MHKTRDELDPIESDDDWESDIPGGPEEPADPYAGKKIIHTNKELYEEIARLARERNLPEMPLDSDSPDFERYSDGLVKILDEVIPQRQLGLYQDSEAVARGENKEVEQIPSSLMRMWYILGGNRNR